MKLGATPKQIAIFVGLVLVALFLQFSGGDATSGLASCASPALLAADGTNQSASGTCVDSAGNESAPATVTGSGFERGVVSPGR